MCAGIYQGSFSPGVEKQSPGKFQAHILLMRSYLRGKSNALWTFSQAIFLTKSTWVCRVTCPSIPVVSLASGTGGNKMDRLSHSSYGRHTKVAMDRSGAWLPGLKSLLRSLIVLQISVGPWNIITIIPGRQDCFEDLLSYVCRRFRTTIPSMY